MDRQMRLQFLGSGDNFGSGGRFQTCIHNDKVIAYSGDTEWSDSLIDVASGADLFICEAYFFEKKIKYHMDYRSLMAHHSEIGCKRLILTHMNTDMLRRLENIDVETAEDGKSITV